ncbi:hypothetical protein [Anaeromyxobacter paludicola]|uniref:Lipoprotein n=1 Tax=Anaeromyxobacter paludicola TaxID=2918171 RepID=A0ABM7XC89_9BACT|nr:hypothetical protein [Anaeromyxobacter paludicola]BDG09493.1 hypothetical protein AMPC_26060 [Anaeromyxobacter paludicola]
MNPIRNVLLSAPMALLAACGGSSVGSNTPQAFHDAAPSYAALSMDQAGATDTSSPAALEIAPAALTASPAATAPSGLLLSGSGCHPHLFLRTREVVDRVNRHVYKVLRHVEAIIARNPTATTGSSEVWDHVNADGVEVRFTVTVLDVAKYGWMLELKAPAATTWDTVLSGDIDRTGATGPHQGKGSLDIDFAKLHQAYPAERADQGTLHVDFDTQAASRLLSVKAVGVAWDVRDDGLGMDAATLAALEAPRSGSYVYFREPGVGGSLKIQDQMVFACPANPTLALADVKLASRWYRTTAGDVHGRSDTVMTGGQLAAPVAKVVGVTCHDGSAETSLEAESFWLMKAEQADGTTVSGESSAHLGADPASVCDAAFGAVPTLTDATSDFAWDPSLKFDDQVPFPFPNMK